MAWYSPTLLRVNVLLIDNDTKSLLETSELLQANLYKVTAVQEASVASSLMISNGSTEFDLVMINVDSSHSRGFEIAHNAVDMGFTVILTSLNANANLVKCAIEDGAFMFMQKPVAAEELKYMWQHILRENSRKAKENQRCARNYRNQPQSPNNAEVNTTASPRSRNKRVVQEANDIAERNERPKTCTEWTPELHERFMAAVKQLGDGKCFPKDILELMNVPGLTRMQVASHLQKCRYGRTLKERGNSQTKRAKTARARNARSKPEKFGLFPSKLVKDSQLQSTVRVSDQTKEAAATSVNDDIELLSTLPLVVEMQNAEEPALVLLNSDNTAKNTSMNEMGRIHAMHGDNSLEPRPQSDESFDFAAVVDVDVIENGHDFEVLNSDQMLSEQEPSYLKTLIESLTGE